MTYVQKYVPGRDGLDPSMRRWWDSHISASYRHARHMLRAARAHAVSLRALLGYGYASSRIRGVRNELDGLLFCLDAASRAVGYARALRRDRDRLVPSTRLDCSSLALAGGVSP